MTKHVREQNWTAIVIDFVIVVIGVFVGIQVSNWNENVTTQRKAEHFAARLIDDIRLEAWSYESLIEYYDDVLDNAERAIDALSGDSEFTDEAFLISAYRASNFGFNERWRATFDELIATGEIGLIDDETLLATAIYVYNTPIFDIIMDNGRNAEFRQIFRKTVPMNIQRELLDQCGDRYVAPLDYNAIVDSLDYECALNISANAVEDAASALRENPAVLPALTVRFADLETALYLLTENRKDSLARLREIGEVPLHQK
jgi:hypothetical protein